MHPYLICFLITILLAYCNERYLKRNNQTDFKKRRITTIIFALLVILPPAILSGLRDYQVGTDVMVYAYQVFGMAKNIHGLGDLFSPQILNSRIESGFFLLAWFSHLFGDDAHIFLFFISLFIGIFVYLILYRMRSFVSIWLGEATYLLCFYNETLNMMRQSMAIVMVMYAFTFVFYKRSWLIFCLLAIPSYFFHHSAVIGLTLFVPILIFGKDNLNLKNSKKYMALIVIIFILFAYISTNFLMIFTLPMLDIFADKLEGFIDNYTITNEKIGLRTLLLYFIPYVLLFIRRGQIKFGYMFLCIALIDTAFYSLRSNYPFFYRLFAYYYWFKILSLSSLPVTKVKTVLSDKVYIVILLLTMFFYWQLTYGGEVSSNIMHGAHETMPYKSEILNIK